jgi:very-short-patch-repair endonuclease
VIGFHNARFFDIDGNLLPDGRKGRKRRECYGKLEIDFLKAVGKKWINKLNIIHEQPFRGSIGTYHVDFYVPSKKLAIETDPEFHDTYKKVAERDMRRDRELSEMYNVQTLRVTPKTLYNPEKLQQLKQEIEDMPTSKETLDGWR